MIGRTCPSGQFKCNSGKCIYSSSKCNNYVDCPGTEKEDETEEACAGKTFPYELIFINLGITNAILTSCLSYA